MQLARKANKKYIRINSPILEAVYKPNKVDKNSKIVIR